VLAASLTHDFESRYGRRPSLLVRAPGRVNLIGEHTDYNDGFVLPLAIDRAAWIALRRRPDRQVSLHSLNFQESRCFSLDRLAHEGGWIAYVAGVAWALQEAGARLVGWEGVLAGDVPIGAGLASSAAVEMAAARAFCAVAGRAWEPEAMARLAQRAEAGWVGVQCGIMDQLVAAIGRAGHAVLIDCRSLESAPVPLPAETVVVVLDTATRRGLLDSAYNERRCQCQEAARALGVPALREATAEMLDGQIGALDPVVVRRARHVISENERTVQAAGAMRRGDAAALGRLMNASHASLRDDYEVSSAELDLMVELAQAEPGCYGARLTGAGFGGCAVALVAAGQVEAFAGRVTAAYAAATGLRPAATVCQAADGAEVVAVDGGNSR
jgi:galactokinase